MHVRRIFIAPESHDRDKIQLRGREAHYLLHVLRLGEGDEVNAFDGRGWSCRAAIAETGRESATLKFLESRQALRPPKAFTIAQAVLKAPAMDEVVQTCTELGASEIIGFNTVRTVPLGTAAPEMRRKLERWRKLAVEACRQCRRDFLPDIRLLPSIEDMGTAVREFDHAFVASLAAGSKPLAVILSSIPVERGIRLLLIIGPEGDFSGEELDRLRDFGTALCNLSDAVLRAETAAIAGAAIIEQHLMAEATPG